MIWAVGFHTLDTHNHLRNAQTAFCQMFTASGKMHFGRKTHTPPPVALVNLRPATHTNPTCVLQSRGLSRSPWGYPYL